MNLINFLITPDAFEGRPWKFAANQIGHFGAIGLLFVLLGLPIWSPIALIISVEVYQVGWRKGSVYDSLEDFGFVMCGALCIAWPVTLPIAAVFLAAGISRRMKG